MKCIVWFRRSKVSCKIDKRILWSLLFQSITSPRLLVYVIYYSFQYIQLTLPSEGANVIPPASVHGSNPYSLWHSLYQSYRYTMHPKKNQPFWEKLEKIRYSNAVMIVMFLLLWTCIPRAQSQNNMSWPSCRLLPFWASKLIIQIACWSTTKQVSFNNHH